MENAKRTYEILNSELHDELPALHDSRILFLVTNMQTLFAAEEVFHSETAKVYGELEGVVDKLAKEAQRGTLPRKTFPKPLPIANHSSNSNLSSNVITTNGNNLNSPPKAVWGSGGSVVSPNTFKRLNDFRHGVLDHVKSYYNASLWQTDSKAPSVLSTPVVAEKPLQVQNGTHAEMPNQLKEAETLKRPSSETETEMPEMSEVSPSLQNGNKHSATTDNLPPGVLYQVKAAYKYQAEDMDELQFEVGEVIDVVEYEDPEEQEEGWLMGVRSSTGQKGLFPANFTRPI